MSNNPKTNMSEEEVELFVYLYDHSVSLSDLSRFMGRDLSTLHRLITKLQLSRDKSIAKLVKQFYDQKGAKQ